MGKTPQGETRERIYRYVRARLIEGQPPTIREIRDALGFRAVQTIYAHLQALVDEGRLVQAEGRARGWRLPHSPSTRTPLLVPLLGQVQAGTWTTALEEPEGYIPVLGRRPAFGRPRVGADGPGQDSSLFALRVRGESMRDLGILPGDVVVVRRQPTAENGDVVVALVGDEATVKTWRRTRQGRVELLPANPDFAPLIPDLQDLTLLGKVIEVRRYLEAGGPIASEAP